MTTESARRLERRGDLEMAHEGPIGGFSGRVASTRHDAAADELDGPRRLLVHLGRPAVGKGTNMADSSRTSRSSQLAKGDIPHGSGLAAALRSLGKELVADRGLHVRFEGTDTGILPGDEIGTVLFRIARELLRNVIDHAEASEVSMVMWRADNTFWLSVEDTGNGFGAAGENGSGRLGVGEAGLSAIREQLRQVSGRMDIITSHPAKGTLIVVGVAG
jgi:signal transduction histidine kinase